MKSLALILFTLLCTVKAFPNSNDNESFNTDRKEYKRNENGSIAVSIKRVRGLRTNSFNLLGGGYPGFMGASISSHITKRLEFEVGIGAISAFTGLKLYLIRPLPKKIAVNISYNVGIVAIPSLEGFYQYIPIEVKYFTRNNISVGFNAGYWIENSASPRLWGGASIGFRFGKQMGN